MISIIILAAGDGSRLQSEIPKVFHKIGGLCLLDHVIKSSKAFSADEIIVVLKEQYKNYPLEFGDAVKKAVQEVPIGSGDAVRCGMNALDKNAEWVYVLYADIPLITPEILQNLLLRAKTCEQTAVVVIAMDAGGTFNLGRLEPAEEEGTIKGIIEAKDLSSSDKTIPLCNVGLLIRADVLNELIHKIKPSKATNELYITEIVKLAYEAGYKCRYHTADSQNLLGVNTRYELSVLERNFQNQMRKKHMGNGVTLVDPETVFFSYDTEIESDVTINPYVVFLRNVQIKKGSIIDSFCTIEGAIIDNAQVGPFARLRPYTRLNHSAKVGNFVEIKNSIIHEHSKVNHLSYIGDCELGQDSNIGAGTITCNYDGFKKHKTIIGENVFIGSNSALVAPITIEDNATIGAGSVITKNVKEGDLAIARGRQKNIEQRSISLKKIKRK